MTEMWRAALVIARRDFTAVVLSKTFIFFLLGPLLPILIGMAFGGLGDKMKSDGIRPSVAVSLPLEEASRLLWARERIASRIGTQNVPLLRSVEAGQDPKTLLARKDAGFIAILSGSFDDLHLTGRAHDIDPIQKDLELMAGIAKAGDNLPFVPITSEVVADSASALGQAQLLTARGAQFLIFFLTMLLAGMILSNMVEEKTNKIIEVLAAAVPIDAIFLGKLMAMLAMSYVGIIFWGGGALAVALLIIGPNFALPPPALGWPTFIALGFLYFAMVYLLIGALFLGIGAQASTVREVQTLNMPVTMGNMAIFFFATYAVDHMGSMQELAACIFPFSSPFAMIARAAQDDRLWIHGVAIIWQMLWVVLIIRFGAGMFRRHVLKSGSNEKKRWFRRPSPSNAQ